MSRVRVSVAGETIALDYTLGPALLYDLGGDQLSRWTRENGQASNTYSYDRASNVTLAADTSFGGDVGDGSTVDKNPLDEPSAAFGSQGRVLVCHGRRIDDCVGICHVVRHGDDTH